MQFRSRSNHVAITSKFITPAHRKLLALTLPCQMPTSSNPSSNKSSHLQVGTANCACKPIWSFVTFWCNVISTKELVLIIPQMSHISYMQMREPIWISCHKFLSLLPQHKIQMRETKWKSLLQLLHLAIPRSQHKF